jgi:hypothetical protein
VVIQEGSLLLFPPSPIYERLPKTKLKDMVHNTGTGYDTPVVFLQNPYSLCNLVFKHKLVVCTDMHFLSVKFIEVCGNNATFVSV